VRPRRTRWLVAAVVLVAFGVLNSILGAHAVARSDTQRSRQAATTSAIEMASTLQLALRREQDLAASAGAIAIMDPSMTQAQFVQWVTAFNLFARYPEILGIAKVDLVPAADLGAFAARALADPVGTLSADGTFQVTPPGDRPYYCLESVAVGRTGQPQTPAGLDLCASGLGPALLSARDTGQGAYVPYALSNDPSLVVGTPIYTGGKVPATVEGRRAAFLGWTGTQILPDTILQAALTGHRGSAVTLTYRDGPLAATFHAGHPPVSAQRTTIDLHNGWKVIVASTPIATGILASPNALAVLVGGTLLAILMAVLLYVLGTSRSRAVQMVHERTDELRFQALHDTLTGLPNRALILDRIGQMLARARRQHVPVAVLFLDLDDFKDINDTLGHRAGDELLEAVGARLDAVVREGDTAGRLGGDEFVILTEGPTLAPGVDVVAQRILEAMAEPFTVAASESPLYVSATIGIAEGLRATPEELLQDADIALYQAKAAGKHCAMIFSPDMRRAVDEHRALEVDLQGALERGEFFLMYQPTVDLATGVFNGVEALLRWQHPGRGLVQPDEFIAELESSGLIVPVGAWVLHTASRQAAEWRRRGYEFTVSVNVSAKQLDNDSLVDDVHAALVLSDLEPERLVLELTETALMREAAFTARRLQELKALGVRIAIDDFGTGYSSLAYLRQFPIDILKIDRSFVTAISDSEESAALVHTLVQLGKLLHIETVAEGIETDDQWARLDREHVEIGQGFLFSRPLTVGDLDALLAASSGAPLVPSISR